MTKAPGRLTRAHGAAILVFLAVLAGFPALVGIVSPWSVAEASVFEPRRLFLELGTTLLGYGVSFAYAPSPRFEVRAETGWLPTDSFSVLTLGVGARYYFTAARFRPYIEVGVHEVRVTVQGDPRRWTAVAVGGAGFVLAVTPSVQVALGARFFPPPDVYPAMPALELRLSPAF